MAKKYRKDEKGNMVEVPENSGAQTGMEYPEGVKPDSIKGAAVNIGKGAVQGVKDFASAVASPLDTAKDVGSRIVGDLKEAPAGAVDAAKKWAKEGIGIGDKVGRVLPWSGKTAEAVEQVKSAADKGGVPAGIGVGIRKLPGQVYEAGKEMVGGILNEDVRNANRAVGQGIIDVASTAATGKVEPKPVARPAVEAAVESPPVGVTGAPPVTSGKPLPAHGLPTPTSAESDPADAAGTSGAGGLPPTQGPPIEKTQDPSTGEWSYSMPGGKITVKGGAEKITRTPGETGRGGFGVRRPADVAGRAPNVINSTGRFGISARDDQAARQNAYNEKIFGADRMSGKIAEADKYSPAEGGLPKFRNKEDEIAFVNSQWLAGKQAKTAKDMASATAQDEEVQRGLAKDAPRLGILQQELEDRQNQTGIDAQRLGIDAMRAGTDAQQAQATIAESQLNAQEKEQLNAARAKVTSAKTPEEKEAATQELAALSGHFPATKDVNPNWGYVEPELNIKGEVVKEGFYYDKNSPTNPGQGQQQNVDPRLAHLPPDTQSAATALLAQYRASRTPADKKRIAAELEKLGVK